MMKTEYTEKGGCLQRDSVEHKEYAEAYSIENQELICKGWFLPPNTYDCGSFVVN